MSSAFITVEGPDGCGKTTFLRGLGDRLRQDGIPVVLTREPGGSSAAEQIRSLLVNGDVNRWRPLSEVLLHSAARNEHVASIIRPALERGDWVLSDRFYDSTLVFQGCGMGVDRSVIETITNIVLGDFRPNLTFLIDVPPEVGMERVYARMGADEAASRYERMNADFRDRVRAGYLSLAAADPDRIVVLDGTGSPDEVLENGVRHIRDRFGIAIGATRSDAASRSAI